MKILAMRSKNIFLIKVSDDKYAMVNLLHKSVQYDKRPDRFLKFGYFEDPIYDDTVVKQIEKLIEG